MHPSELPVLVLDGPPRQRGEVHGETFREKITMLYGGWVSAVEKTTQQSINNIAADFLGATRIEAAMRQWTPDLYQELEGLAAGASLPFAPFFMFNSTDENEWFLKYRGYGLELPEARGCSSACINGATRYVGQNMDIPGATDGYQVLLHIKHENSDLEAYVVSLTGMLALMGLNNSPLGVVNNSLRQLNSRIDGLPVNVMVRALLERDSYAAATEFVRTAPHASGQNYIIAGAADAGMFECSGNGATEIRSDDGVLVHTNHPLQSEDVNTDERFNRNSSSSDTQVRLDDLAKLVAQAPPDHNTLLQALSSHSDPENPVCRHLAKRGNNFTAASVIYEMSQPPVLYVTPGPPCQDVMRRLEFARPVRG